jgi:gliding motility-associated-like protein
MKYKWRPAYGLSDPYISNPKALPAIDTSYILTIQSAGGGCISTDTVKVFVKNINNSLEVIGDSIHCLGTVQFPVLKVSPVNHVQWYRNNLPIAGADQLTYTVSQTGTYYALLLSDICSDPLPTRDIYIPFDTTSPGITYPETEVAYNFTFKLHSRDFNNGVIWTPPTSLDNPNSSSPNFKSLNSQLYTIQLRDELGCITVDTQYVKTYKDIAIYVPSAFTPDGDGINDYLRPLLLGFEKVKYFRVYDRWGKLLFETRSDYPGWDGRVKNLVQEPQTVIWILEAVDVDGKTHVQKGTSVLMH